MRVVKRYTEAILLGIIALYVALFTIGGILLPADLKTGGAPLAVGGAFMLLMLLVIKQSWKR